MENPNETEMNQADAPVFEIASQDSGAESTGDNADIELEPLPAADTSHLHQQQEVEPEIEVVASPQPASVTDASFVTAPDVTPTVDVDGDVVTVEPPTGNGCVRSIGASDGRTETGSEIRSPQRAAVATTTSPGVANGTENGHAESRAEQSETGSESMENALYVTATTATLAAAVNGVHEESVDNAGDATDEEPADENGELQNGAPTNDETVVPGNGNSSESATVVVRAERVNSGRSLLENVETVHRSNSNGPVDERTTSVPTVNGNAVDNGRQQHQQSSSRDNQRRGDYASVVRYGRNSTDGSGRGGRGSWYGGTGRTASAAAAGNGARGSYQPPPTAMTNQRFVQPMNPRFMQPHQQPPQQPHQQPQQSRPPQRQYHHPQQQQQQPYRPRHPNAANGGNGRPRQQSVFGGRQFYRSQHPRQQ